MCKGEANRRDQARIARALNEAQLPCGKSFSNFEFAHVSSVNPATVMSFAQDGEWLNRAENILMFGPSGVGKTPKSQCHRTFYGGEGSSGEVHACHRKECKLYNMPNCNCNWETL